MSANKNENPEAGDSNEKRSEVSSATTSSSQPLFFGKNSRLSQYMKLRKLNVVHHLINQKKTYSAMLNEMPRELYTLWADTAKEEFPGISKTPKFFVESAVGLMEYFKCVEMARGEQTVLASNAADSVWHAWLLFDETYPDNENNLKSFTKRNFSREIDHLPVGDFKSNSEDALARTFVLNCLLNGFDFVHGAIPSVFRLDGRLKMPGGWKYRRVSATAGVAHCVIDKNGRPGNQYVSHPGICLQKFQELGYLTEIPYMDQIPLAILCEPSYYPARSYDQIQSQIMLQDLIFLSYWDSMSIGYDPYFYGGGGDFGFYGGGGFDNGFNNGGGFDNGYNNNGGACGGGGNDNGNLGGGT